MPAKHDFKCWYTDILTGLYDNGNAGFVLLMIAFPLFERYLREKSGVHEGDLNEAFYTELRKIFPIIPDNTVGRQFWQVYRNGLLHQVALSQQSKKGIVMPRAWLSGDADMLTISPTGDFWVHPAKFAKHIMTTIEGDFTIFEGVNSPNHPLPAVHVVATMNGTGAMPTVRPTGMP
jgi:hypothetical protein